MSKGIFINPFKETDRNVKKLTLTEEQQRDCRRSLRLNAILDAPYPSYTEQINNGLNPYDAGPTIYVKKEDPLTFIRLYTSEATEVIKGRRYYEKGLHVWEVYWTNHCRGEAAMVGVSDRQAPLHFPDYRSLLEQSQHIWGWDLMSRHLLHTRNYFGVYPEFIDEEFWFNIPDKFLMILDMDNGTLGFMVDDYYMGSAFNKLQGKSLTPFIATTPGNISVKLTYQGGLEMSPLPLTYLCQQKIKQILGKRNVKNKIEELPLPKRMKLTLHHTNATSPENEEIRGYFVASKRLYAPSYHPEINYSPVNINED